MYRIAPNWHFLLTSKSVLTNKNAFHFFPHFIFYCMKTSGWSLARCSHWDRPYMHVSGKWLTVRVCLFKIVKKYSLYVSVSLASKGTDKENVDSSEIVHLQGVGCLAFKISWRNIVSAKQRHFRQSPSIVICFVTSFFFLRGCFFSARECNDN